MRIFVLGGTGFIGRHLLSHLLGPGHELLILSRSPKPELEQAGVTIVGGNPLQPGAWQQEAAGCDAVVNLVGRNIFDRWTEKVKQEILNSRLQATNMAVQAVEQADGDKPVLINANATGYYPFAAADHPFDEAGPAGDHFLARVCVAWQEAALHAASLGSRVVIARFAPVLAADGGMLDLVLPMFAKGVGGRIGSGRQPFPWVHVLDLVRALELSLTTEDIHGPVNVCAPQVVTNAGFTQALARAVHRPALLPVPEFALRLRFGQLADTLSKGQAVIPAVLQNQGFTFMYSDIEATLQEIAAQRD
jgi:hypothetical protein